MAPKEAPKFARPANRLMVDTSDVEESTACVMSEEVGIVIRYSCCIPAARKREGGVCVCMDVVMVCMYACE